jgi:hypothetical protein
MVFGVVNICVCYVGKSGLGKGKVTLEVLTLTSLLHLSPQGASHGVWVGSCTCDAQVYGFASLGGERLL